MKTIMKFLLAPALLCSIIPASYGGLYQNKAVKVPRIVKDTTLANPFPVIRDTSFNQIDTKIKLAAARLRLKVAMARQYCIANDFNTEIIFMVDMAIPSGKKRFFIYNLTTDSVEFTSLVSHGSGSYKPNTDDQLLFSNLPNSNATSLGRYKIGGSYQGSYGLSYKLYGLDSTNNNAFQRSIVLHSTKYVPDKETYPYHIFESSGCPCVSPTFLNMLDKYVKKSKKPMLLWIYN